MNTSFRKSERLCSKTAIDELFLKAKSLRSGAFTVKFVKKESVDTEQPKVLISVPKRYLKSAVDRNRVKRLIREVYRLHKDLWQKDTLTDHLAIIYNSSKIPSYQDVEKHLLTLFKQL